MTSRYLLFLLSERLFGVKLVGAIEILPWRPSRCVPLSYSYVEGLIDYRGTIYPVFNLERVLGLNKQGPIGFNASEAELTAKGKSIILLEQNGAPFGIVVDSVLKMTQLEEPAERPKQVEGVDPTYVRGRVLEDDREVLILEFGRLLNAG